jgi:uncharacterized integral membrane protein (TIGR00697 family)
VENQQSKYSIWFVLLVGVFITCLITANIIAVKLVNIFGLIVPAAVVIFPISYIVGDVLTEVYGYGTARRVIWIGFLCNLIAVICILIGQSLQGAPFWDSPSQAAYERILGYSPRLLVASFIAYLIGEFANSFVLSKMKVMTNGRWLWARTIGSTIVGEGLDSLVFLTIAFVNTPQAAALPTLIVTQWLFKVAYEAIATPLTYAVIDFFKRKEGLDTFDRNTSFNPLALSQ